MTLAEVRTLVRLYARMSTVTLSTTELDLLINTALVRTAMDFCELNPLACGIWDAHFTLPVKAANLVGYLCDGTSAAIFQTMNNQEPLKILNLAYKDPTDRIWVNLVSASWQEMGGTGGNDPDLGIHSPTGPRWTYNGGWLVIYPLPEDTMTLWVTFTQTPTLLVAAEDYLFASWSQTIRQYSELVPLRATALLLRVRGMDTAWIDAEETAYWSRCVKQLQTLQQQSPEHIPGTRYNTEG